MPPGLLCVPPPVVNGPRRCTAQHDTGAQPKLVPLPSSPFQAQHSEWVSDLVFCGAKTGEGGPKRSLYCPLSRVRPWTHRNLSYARCASSMLPGFSRCVSRLVVLRPHDQAVGARVRPLHRLRVRPHRLHRVNELRAHRQVRHCTAKNRPAFSSIDVMCTLRNSCRRAAFLRARISPCSARPLPRATGCC